MSTVYDFVEALATASRIEDIVPQSATFVRRTNSVLGKTVLIIVSHEEPHDVQNIPLNVLWACFTKSSHMYRKLYKRTTRDADPANGTQNTWVRVNHIEDIWEDQVYEPGQEPDPNAAPPIASVERRGIMTISNDSDDPDLPTVVVAEDPRNTDPRYPLLHDSMHPEKPLVSVKTRGPNVTMNFGDVVDGYLPIGRSLEESEYRKLSASEIHETAPAYVGPPRDPATLDYEPETCELFIPELTNMEYINGVSVGPKEFTILVRAYGVVDTDTGFRNFLGYYRPNTVRVQRDGETQTLAGYTYTVGAVGSHQIFADLRDAAGTATVTVRGTLVGV